MAGQTLIIFALSITALLGLAGLSIDVARAYDLFARMQRAAEAGALAGVLYMPNSYNTMRSGDVDSAISRASKELVKNGFGTVLATNASACGAGLEIQICQVSTRPSDLKVIITEQLNVVLLSGLGVQPITLVASGQAEYLPPIQMGSRLNYFGDEVECSTASPPDPTTSTSCAASATTNGSGQTVYHLQNFFATVNGPASVKENGDPFVYCEEGTSAVNSITGLDGSSYTLPMFNGNTTNHPQWSTNGAVLQQHCGPPVSGGNPGNPDQEPPGYTGPATAGSSHPGGYNYIVKVPTAGASLWVFNPTFVPGDRSMSPYTSADTVRTSPNMHDPFGGGLASIVNGHYDAAPLYFTMTYTLYTVHDLYDRTTDTQVGSQVVFPPYDNYAADLALHGCSGFGSTYVYDPYWQDYQTGGTWQTPGTTQTSNSYHNPGGFIPGNGCYDISSTAQPTWHSSAPSSACYMTWCKVASNLPVGTYRFVVEDTGLTSNVAEYHSSLQDGIGTHLYSVKVCAGSSITNPVGSNCPTGATGGNPGVAVAGWNNMEISFTQPLQKPTPDPNNPATSCVSSASTEYACLDLGCIPTAYAGRIVNIRLFDPGDPGNLRGGDLYVAIPPSNGSTATVSYPSWLTASYLANLDGDNAVHTWFGATGGSYNEFNGLWLTAQAQMPGNYSGNCLVGPGGTGWWQLAYISHLATANDWLNVQFSLVGSPVHLVPLS